MIDLLIIAIVLVFLLIGTYTDIRTREVPDWVNYSAIFAGLGIRLIYSLSSWDFSYILAGLIGFGIFLVIALAMFYLGQWGGGDTKMLMGIGALLGFEMRPDGMLISFFINMLFVGAAYGILWSLALAAVHWKRFVKEVKKLSKGKEYFIRRSFAFGLAFVIVIISLFSKNMLLKIFLLVIALGMVLTFYLFVLIKATENCSMIKKLPVSKLTEGDWIVKDMYIKAKKTNIKRAILNHIKYLEIYRKPKEKRIVNALFRKTVSIRWGFIGIIRYLILRINKKEYGKNRKAFERLINSSTSNYDKYKISKGLAFNRKDIENLFRAYRFKPGKEYICGPKDLGISEKQIKKLKKLNIRRILVKDGMPFVPIFLLSFILTLIIGNIILLFI